MKISKHHTQTLFNLLSSFGFSKTQTGNFIIFKKGEEVIAFPNSDLQLKHFMSTRKHLDMNGWIAENKFNAMFKIEIL